MKNLFYYSTVLFSLNSMDLWTVAAIIARVKVLIQE